MFSVIARAPRLIIAFLFLGILSQLAYSQNISCVSDTNETLTCVVTVTGIKEKKAVASAESALRYALFFRGIPDSKHCKQPLVGTDESFAANHPKYFKEMFDDDRFASFITNTDFISYTKKNKISVVSFTVNIKALRLDLEGQGVKRRFGL